MGQSYGWWLSYRWWASLMDDGPVLWMMAHSYGWWPNLVDDGTCLWPRPQLQNWQTTTSLFLADNLDIWGYKYYSKSKQNRTPLDWYHGAEVQFEFEFLVVLLQFVEAALHLVFLRKQSLLLLKNIPWFRLQYDLLLFRLEITKQK